MPAQERVGFEDEERVSPVLHATGTEDEPEAIGLRKRGAFHLTVNAKRDQLLAEQSVFSDEVGFARCEICDGAENNRVAGELDQMP